MTLKAVEKVCRHAILASTMMFLCSIALPIQSHATLIDKVVAVVNDQVITLSELEDEGSEFFKKIQREVPADEQDSAMRQAREKVLDGLIDKALVRQEAAKQKISVSDKEVDAAFQKIISANKTDQKEFEEKLREQGLTLAGYKDNLKSQILQNKLVNRDVRSKIIITDDMMLDYYDKQYTKHLKEGEYYLLQIGISWGKDKSSRKSTATLYEDKLAARKKAEKVHDLAVNGQDFRKLARSYSDLPSAEDGGDIGVFTEDDMAGSMKNVVTSLKPGEISPIIETPAGFQFFKLLSSKEGGIVMKAPYDSVKDEIRDHLFQEAMKKDMQKWIKGIKENAYIKIL